MKVPFVETDGGRSLYFKGDARDCVTRAVAIAFEMDYREAYDLTTDIQREFVANTRSKKCKKAGTARSGVYKKATRLIMEHLGATWTPTMGIGTGCTVHVRPDELPSEGRYILKLSGHVAAWVDGALHDAYDSSRDGTRCVYGYWTIPKPKKEEHMPGITNEQIFKTTEIMLHPRKHNTYQHKKWEGIYEVSYSDRERIGMVIKDAQAWRFMPLDGIRYGSKSLKDIGATLELLNKHNK